MTIFPRINAGGVIAAIAIGVALSTAYQLIIAPPSPATLLRCFTNGSQNAACVRSTLQTLLEQYSPRDIMAFVTASSAPQVLIDECHAIGHTVGELSYKKYGTVESALAQCGPQCRSACTHGAIGAAVLNELGVSFASDDIAHSDRTELLRYVKQFCTQTNSMCHAIGHVAFLTATSDAAALSVCDTVSIGVQRENCYQGVFMERAGTFGTKLFPSASSSPAQSTHDYTFPCSSLPKQYRNSCYMFINLYQQPLLFSDGIRDDAEKLKKAVAVCSDQEQPDRAYCFTGIGISHQMFGFRDMNSSQLQNLCDGMPDVSDRSACTLGVIPDFLYPNSRGLFDYCEAIGEPARRTLCYDAAFQFLSESGSPGTAQHICATSHSCQIRYEAYLNASSTIPDYRFGLFSEQTRAARTIR